VIDVRKTALDGVLEIRTPRHGDARGFFSEVWSRESWREAGLDIDWVQDNHSRSTRQAVLRGLHYQLPPVAQDKLVRVTRGAIFDVSVDIRRSSPDFGRWVGVIVSADEWNQLLIPKGFAHGFVTLEADTEVQYKVSAPYSPDHERTIRYDDPDIGIAWPDLGSPYQMSEKDGHARPFAKAEVFA
jgi:dTDP-4-dehydrorhamnose 3,5-epimerase